MLPPDCANPDIVNNFFASTQSIADPDQDTLNFYRENILVNVSTIFKFEEVTTDEILKALNSIHSNAVGPDGVSIKMIRLCCPFILAYLEHIFNYCILNSLFPSCWKLSNIIPLPKTNNPTAVSDLRPISILSVLGKVFEGLIGSQLRMHLNKFDILPSTQSGFRAGFSCVSTLTNVVDDVLRAADVGRVSALVMLDFSKAFDTINHEILLAILHFIGLGESACALLSNYLLNRNQRVIISGHFSEDCRVRSGVPQGSILGPLLFTIYTSQLANSVKHCNLHMYADDTQIYRSFCPAESRQSLVLINNDIDSLVSVAARHSLNINPLKSSFMLLGSRQNRQRVDDSFVVVVGDTPIPVVEEAVSLGIWLDSDLRFKKQIKSVLQKSYSTLRILYSNRHILNRDLKKLLCESLVLSHANYGDTLYHYCMDASDGSRVQRLQNSCLRFVYGIRRRDRISHTLNWAGWLSMSQRRFLHVACFFHRILLMKSPPYLYNKIRFRTDVHTLNLRHRSTITIPRHNLELFKRSFSYRIASVYNALPNHIKSLSYSTFKFRLRDLLLRGGLYST